MAKPAQKSSNCLLLEQMLNEVISRLDSITLHDLREGHINVGPIVAAIQQIEEIRKTLHSML